MSASLQALIEVEFPVIVLIEEQETVGIARMPHGLIHESSGADFLIIIISRQFSSFNEGVDSVGGVVDHVGQHEGKPVAAVIGVVELIWRRQVGIRCSLGSIGS